jgi:hypothetical protein
MSSSWPDGRSDNGGSDSRAVLEIWSIGASSRGVRSPMNLVELRDRQMTRRKM